MTREQWLHGAIDALTDLFTEQAMELPPVHVSTGFPSRGGLSTKKRVLGECWKPEVSEDGQSHIFINPMMEKTKDVLGVLIHELIHAWDRGESGHRGAFVTGAKALGLEGPWTSTQVGKELGERLDNLIESIGEYPHKKLNPLVQKKPQTTRMLKLTAEDCCGMVVRTTKKWLEEAGLPFCPHETEMVLEVKEEEDDV